VAFYRYSKNRCAEDAQALLASCRGFLHADGYAGFNDLFANDSKTGKPRLTEVACWGHARLNIYEVYESKLTGSKSFGALHYFDRRGCACMVFLVATRASL
jgi:hypothetical protein